MFLHTAMKVAILVTYLIFFNKFSFVGSDQPSKLQTTKENQTNYITICTFERLKNGKFAVFFSYTLSGTHEHNFDGREISLRTSDSHWFPVAISS